MYVASRLFPMIMLWLVLMTACESTNQPIGQQPNAGLHQLFNSYWETHLRLYPLEATAIGDTRYNDRLPISISSTYRDTLRNFYQAYLDSMQAFNEALHAEDEISRELFIYEMQTNLQALKYPGHLMPINQFWSFTLEFPQLGSGSGNQPFNTQTDYLNFLQRMKRFPAWCDTAMANMRVGISQNIVLPKVLAERVVPQLRQVMTTDPTKSIFYQPVLNLPKQWSDSTKKDIQNRYFYEISHSIIPAYNKLLNFFQKEYIPACRETDGFAGLPDGANWYQQTISYFTTTTLQADSIYQLGLQEVGRLSAEMDKVKVQVGFKGSLQEFFEFMNSDPQFFPFQTAQEVLDSFWAIHKLEIPQLKKLFVAEPKTRFEIRQTEAFRAASASAEYNAGSEDGKRPGVFYVPILDPRKFNFVGMETLFLHEAIPGHHYQISLQQENKSLPQFRKYLGYSAYAEGWALYTETLGPDLGLYKNPYQYFGHLSDAMHRAIRLVVDVGLHTGKMSHDAAIAYMQSHERISPEEARAEIERYMAIPGQALSYKIGQLRISSLRKQLEKKLGPRFSLPQFHEQILNGGNMPLQVLEKKLQRWADNL